MSVAVTNRMVMSGFCAFPSTTELDSHMFCAKQGCTCPCHKEEVV